MSTAALELQTLKLNGRDAHQHYADLMTAVTDLAVTQTVTGASTIDITLADAKRTLIRSAALTQASRVVLDNAGYTLVAVHKSGQRVTLTFEDDAVALLRKHNSYRKAAAGTTTRPGFVTLLIREVPDLKVVVAPGASKNLVELARGSGKPAGGASKVVDGQVVDSGAEDTWTAAGRIMGEIGWRVYCYRGTIYLAPDSWLIAHNGVPYTLSPETVGVHDIDYDWDVGKPAATATITAQAGFHDLAPAAPIKLKDMGAADGSWLVETIKRTPFSSVVTVTAVRPQPTLPEPTTTKTDVGDFGIPAFLPEYLGDQGTSAASPGGFQSSPTATPGGADPTVGGLLAGKATAFVDTALAKKGFPYIYGASGPAAFDCSGFIMWCARQVGVAFSKPVTSMAASCRAHGTLVTVSQAAYMRGAIIWRERGGGAHDHIVISLGDGQHTIEAMGHAYGVVVGKIPGRDWTGAGYVPGIPVKVPALRDLRPG